MSRHPCLKFIFVLGLALIISLPAAAKTEKKKIIYRTHTQLDFSGETVQGKVRAPEVFYIFQRKRSEERHIVRTPANLDHQLDATLSRMQEGLPK